MATYNNKTDNMLKVLYKNRHKLKERTKELACLYSLLRISVSCQTIDEFLGEAVKVIPPSWQYPEITGAKITFRDKEYSTENFQHSKWMQKCDIKPGHGRLGSISVCYLKKKLRNTRGLF
ncbi:MAG: hypothetical protein ACQEP5_07250 [Actinomycetota bacterium]